MLVGRHGSLDQEKEKAVVAYQSESPKGPKGSDFPLLYKPEVGALRTMVEEASSRVIFGCVPRYLVETCWRRIVRLLSKEVPRVGILC